MNDLRGTSWPCEKCGHENDNDFIACEKCGHRPFAFKCFDCQQLRAELEAARAGVQDWKRRCTDSDREADRYIEEIEKLEAESTWVKQQYFKLLQYVHKMDNEYDGSYVTYEEILAAAGCDIPVKELPSKE